MCHCTLNPLNSYPLVGVSHLNLRFANFSKPTIVGHLKSYLQHPIVSLVDDATTSLTDNEQSAIFGDFLHKLRDSMY